MISSKQWTTAFLTRYRTADLEFIDAFLSNNEEMSLTILYGMDPDFTVLYMRFHGDITCYTQRQE
jgi:hypothetical protein